MVQLKKIIYLSLALAVAAVSLGVDQGFCETKPKSKGTAQQTQGEIKSSTPSQKNPQLSKRNQMMLEVEASRIRRANIIAESQDNATVPKK